MGGLFSMPNNAGVSPCAISRIGTRTSGREPSTNIFCEFGRGWTAALSTCASRAKNLSLAFMALLKQLRSVGAGSGAGKLRAEHASLRRHYPHRYQGCDLTVPRRAGGPLASVEKGTPF